MGVFLFEKETQELVKYFGVFFYIIGLKLHLCTSNEGLDLTLACTCIK